MQEPVREREHSLTLKGMYIFMTRSLCLETLSLIGKQIIA